MRYECKPGEHIIWSGSENSDYIQTFLLEDKIYLIEVRPKMGLTYARVQLTPYLKDGSKDFYKQKKKLFKILSNDDNNKTVGAVISDKDKPNYREEIINGKKRYEELIQKNKIDHMNAEQFLE